MKHCKNITLLLILSIATQFQTGALSAQKVATPLQTTVIDSVFYIVELIPAKTAQDNMAKQLVQITKQIETTEKQLAEIVKKRDGLLQQKTMIEAMQAQIAQAVASPPAPVAKQVAAPPETKPAKKPKKPKKPKN